jgi:hypothetical protein
LTTAPDAGRRVNWRSWAIALLSLAVVLTIVLIAVFRRSDYPHDVASSDLKACDLVDHAAVASAAGATEFKDPGAPKVGTAQFHNSGDGADTINVDIHNRDQCIYYLDATDSEQAGIAFLQTSVVPHNPAMIGPLFTAGAGHAVKDGMRYAPLPGVGNQAVLGTGGSGSLLSYTVDIRVGSWDIEVDGRLPERRMIAVATLLAKAPRLIQPPRPTG